MERRKYLIKCIMVTFLVLFMVGLPLQDSWGKKKQIKLNLATWGPPKGTVAKGLRWYADEVGKRTNNRVKIKIFWAGSLAKAMELPHACRTGSADMAAMLCGYFNELFPFAAAGMETFLLAGRNCGEGINAYWQLREEFPEVKREFQKQNQKLLATWEPERVEVMSVIPITKLADFKGLKLRTVGSTFPKVFSAAGAICISMPSSEQYDALSRGLVKGVPGTIETIYKWKLYEVAKYRLGVKFLGTTPNLYSISINLDVWKKLPPDVRQVLKEVGEGYMKNYPKWSVEEGKKYEKVFRDSGVKYNMLPDADLEVWEAKVARPVYEEYVKKTEKKGYSNARRILDRYAELLNFNPYKYPMPK